MRGCRPRPIELPSLGQRQRQRHVDIALTVGPTSNRGPLESPNSVSLCSVGFNPISGEIEPPGVTTKRGE